MPSKTNAGSRPSPPISFTKCWDKGKWHFESESFPPALPPEAGYAHILSVLRFLHARGFLTSEGEEEMNGASGDEICLLDEHIRVEARAFLDQAYKAYLGKCEYEKPPPVRILETEWAVYETKYDLSKRTKANPYQALLLERSPDRTLDTLLLRLRSGDPDLLGDLRGTVEYMSQDERMLVDAVLASNDQDPVSLARTHKDPALLLHALRYLNEAKYTSERLHAAAILAERLEIKTQSSPFSKITGLLLRETHASRTSLKSLAWAVNFTRDAKLVDQFDGAWTKLSRREQEILAGAVNSLFESEEDQHLALCGMRSVGDARSLELINSHPRCPREGTAHFGDGRVEPAWEEIRRQARQGIQRRLDVRK
jgi:hypothetical protein